MKRVWLKSGITTTLITAILPLYLLLSFSAVLCSFHHPAEGGIKNGHQHASGNPDHNQASNSAGNFCKYAQTLSPITFTASAENFVSFTQVAKAFLYSPFFPTKVKSGEHFLRGPPFLINL